jgi:cytochrome c553
MRLRSTLLLLGLGFAASFATAAQAEGDAASGKALAYTCLGCHGVPNYKNAAPVYSVPKLGGQRAAYLASALKAYSAGERAHGTMHAQAASMNDQDRADIAAFFQGPERKPSTQVAGTPPASTAVCVACHGNNGFGISADYPTLAGQYQDYIEEALHDYKSGKRKNAVMAGIMTSVKVEDIPAIAAFYAAQQGLCGADEIQKLGKCKSK